MSDGTILVDQSGFYCLHRDWVHRVCLLHSFASPPVDFSKVMNFQEAWADLSMVAIGGRVLGGISLACFVVLSTLVSSTKFWSHQVHFLLQHLSPQTLLSSVLSSCVIIITTTIFSTIMTMITNHDHRHNIPVITKFIPGIISMQLTIDSCQLHLFAANLDNGRWPNNRWSPASSSLLLLDLHGNLNGLPQNY